MAKKVSKIIKQMTLSEFKAWLEGIEEVQPPGWHPTVEQWKLIRDRISNIIVEIRQEYINAPTNIVDSRNVHHQPQSSLDQAFINTPKIVPEPFIPKIPVDVLGRPIQPGSVGGIKATDNGTMKTPDLQTTTYTTSFE